MINLLRTGHYKLIDTKGGRRILLLDNDQYAWIDAKDIGQILVYSENRQTYDDILSAGLYKLYEVRDEPDLTDLQHLELEVGDGLKQGYLLLTGLPTVSKKRSRIITTDQLVDPSKN